MAHTEGHSKMEKAFKTLGSFASKYKTWYPAAQDTTYDKLQKRYMDRMVGRNGKRRTRNTFTPKK